MGGVGAGVPGVGGSGIYSGLAGGNNPGMSGGMYGLMGGHVGHHAGGMAYGAGFTDPNGMQGSYNAVGFSFDTIMIGGIFFSFFSLCPLRVLDGGGYACEVHDVSVA